MRPQVFKRHPFGQERFEQIMIKPVKSRFVRLPDYAEPMKVIWQWLASGLDIEASAGAEASRSVEVQYTSVFRALFLSELIENISRFSLGKDDSVTRLKPGTFIEVTSKMLQLIPLPTFASLSLYDAITAFDEQSSPVLDPDKAVLLAEKFAGGQRALAFRMHMQEGDSLLSRLFRQAPEEYFNALIMSKDDHVIAIAADDVENPTAIVFTLLEERYLRRNNSVFVGTRPVVFFGQLGFLSPGDDKKPALIGIECISISLA
jgi:hypothetical protein